MSSEGLAGPGSNPRVIDSEFKIPGWLEIDFLSDDERLIIENLAPLTNKSGIHPIDKLVTRKPSQEKLEAHRPQNSKNPRELEGRNAVNAKHCHRGRVVGEHHGTTLTRAPPQTLFAKRELPVLEIHGDVAIEELKMIHGGDRGVRQQWQGHCRIRIRRGADQLPRSKGQSRIGRGILILTPDIDNQASIGCPSGEACNIVEALGQRPSKIIGNRLTKMEAVVQRLARGSCKSCVHGFGTQLAVRPCSKRLQLRREFPLQCAEKLLRSLLRSGIRRYQVLRFTQKP